MELIECLKTAIGLSNRECDCLDLDTSPYSNESESLYYVDDIFDGANLLELNSSLQCDDSVINILDKARERAISDFISNLNAEISEHNNHLPIMDRHFGNLEKATKLLLQNVDSAGLAIKANSRKSKSTMTIHYVGLKVNTSEPITVRLERNGESIKEWQINTIAGSHAINTEKITVPLSDPDTMQIHEYRIVYDLGNTRPYETKVYCCGMVGDWADYASFRGISTVGPSSSYHEKTMWGITAKITIQCDQNWMCGMDYMTNPWARTTAKVIQLMSIQNVYKYIINSNEINRFTLMPPESITERMQYLSDEIKIRMEKYLALKLPEAALDCYTCNPKMWVGDIY